MDIVEVESTELEECSDIVFESEMGKRYYSSNKEVYRRLRAGMEEGDKIYTAKNHNGCMKGILWYQQEGIFHAFPYLHMIVVRNSCQYQGIGKSLLDFFEYNTLVNGYNTLRTKVFLTVGDYNINAENIYKKRGYIQVGEIADLYRKGTTEKLYMKIVTASEFIS